MRSVRLAALATLGLFVLALAPGCACGSTHSRDDAGPLADGEVACSGSRPLYCEVCGGDAGRDPICVGGSWACPLGSQLPGTCPPTCWGPPPSADCVCNLMASPAEWVCDSECPSGIDPWNPENPANACSPEGRSCRSGGGSACGFFMGCDCEGGRWSCVVAEPDPACWCGREPELGSACNEEGALCGSCCPTPESPEPFGPFTCIDGHWSANDCPAIECPSIDPPACPAVREIGTPCASEGQTCGDVCCSAQTCVDGVWMPGPEADCLCDPTRSFACGSGSCTDGNACTSYCGPDDGLEHRCDPLPEGCTSCGCLDLEPGQLCEDRDGHVFSSGNELCG